MRVHVTPPSSLLSLSFFNLLAIILLPSLFSLTALSADLTRTLASRPAHAPTHSLSHPRSTRCVLLTRPFPHRRLLPSSARLSRPKQPQQSQDQVDWDSVSALLMVRATFGGVCDNTEIQGNQDPFLQSRVCRSAAIHGSFSVLFNPCGFQKYC